jgi:aspartate/methionine/tyrosine aminotransferase
MMINISPESDSRAFSERLLEERCVSVVPGSAFGPNAEGWVRIALTVPEEAIEAGLTRLASFMTTSQGA